MADSTGRPAPTGFIPVGDDWRATLGLPVFGTMGLAAAFFLYTAPVKEMPSLFDHAPWLNDPFDTVISFMMFFVPSIAILCIPRVLLCRRSEPLPAARIRDVLRGCRVVLGGVSLTLASEWIALAIQDNRHAWNGATWLQVGLLMAMTGYALGMVAVVRHTGLPREPARQPSEPVPDWLGDSLAWLGAQSRIFGPTQRSVLRGVTYLNDTVVGFVRRRPLWSALAVCTVFGVGVGTIQGFREGYSASITVVVSSLLAIGMFGLIAASGNYLGLVHSSAPLCGVRRRLLDAAVITCLGILVPFALRYHLWWMVGSTNAMAGLTQLLGLLSLFAAVIFAVAYTIESKLRVHSPRA
jgi:hypothetical protein